MASGAGSSVLPVTFPRPAAQTFATPWPAPTSVRSGTPSDGSPSARPSAPRSQIDVPVTRAIFAAWLICAMTASARASGDVAAADAPAGAQAAPISAMQAARRPHAHRPGPRAPASNPRISRPPGVSPVPEEYKYSFETQPSTAGGEIAAHRGQ